MHKDKIVVGIMSGTSLDGIDYALCKISDLDKKIDVELISYASYPYPKNILKQIKQASFDETSSVSLITQLHYELGKLYSTYLTKFIKESKFDGKIDAVGLHGQTIHHLPDKKATLQIGAASFMAYEHKVDVVSNFREMDIVAGGEGAPLVPYTEWLLYDDLLLQNIGGIGNITVLPKNATLDEVYAFDTGPGNMMINYATEYYYQKPFDEDGLYAAKGQVIKNLLNELLAHSYLNVKPPKSTGREMFGEDVTRDICERYPTRANDVIRTLTEFTALSIKHSIEMFVKEDIKTLVVGGGGAYNKTLMNALKTHLNKRVLTHEDVGYSSDAKEAIAFALLAYKTMLKETNNAPKATGAKDHVILGQITYGHYGGDE
ncbi:MAG TPA: anhydro-N-acetylmuramic acid kinase AnmK [Erysipelothrix sp.]|nr:anhydro-N-acetylmuramic acid kinase AnmK [Erysipelothrix sp.]